jgi:hypothetical protein
MGCYDMVVGNFVCPYCNNVERIVLDQTKAGECNFTDYGLGECAPGFYDDFSDKGNHNCEKCKRKYNYTVTFQSGIMTSINILDKVFNKNYTYYKKEECIPKQYTETDLKDMSSQLKWMNQVLDFNTQKIKQAENVINDIIPKIDLLRAKISNQVNQKYGL